ncbi:fimbrial biogenesis outer membrane usher protein [Enterobacter ludwigii]|nr:fimbrial biogenesis outer membrane usher protein [Enterobacter ludwigii]
MFINTRLKILAVAIMAISGNTSAKEVFNLHALEIGNPAGQPVDISRLIMPGGQLPGVYHVRITVNGTPLVDAENITFVESDKGNLAPQITPAMLSRWGVKVEAFPELNRAPQEKPLRDIGEYIPDATAVIDFEAMKLNVTIPQAAMDKQAQGWVDPSLWDEGIPAVLLNYNLSGSDTWRRDQPGKAEKSYYANLQGGINIGPWRLRNSSTWDYNETDGGHWNTISTSLSRDIQSLRSQFTVGDTYTDADIFDSVKMRGLQLASDDSMLPDSQRGFAPVIRGIAKSNAQVTIKQHGNVIYQTYVAPGAFVIDDLYPTSNSGDLDVTIKEADGSERHFTQAFSSVPVMQREGQYSYALAAGKYSSPSSGANEPDFIQGTLIYGLPHGLSLYGGVLYSRDYASAAIGAGMSLGELGSVSADLTQAKTTFNTGDSAQGRSVRVQYAKNIDSTDTNLTLAATRFSTADYYSFEDANENFYGPDTQDNTDSHKRQKLQLQINQSVGDWGSFYLSGYRQSYWDNSDSERTLSAGWNGSVKGITYSLSYTHTHSLDSDEDDDRQVAFSLQVPLSRFLPNAWASYNMNGSTHGSTRHQIGLSGTALEDNNLSYSVQESFNGHDVGTSGNASASWKGTYGEVRGGYNYDADSHQINYGAQGGIIVHPWGVTFSQSLGDSVVLVKAPGAAGAKVQNNTGVRTDWRGYTVVPSAQAYRLNRVAIDPESLPDNVDLDNAVKTVVPTKGAVVVADFNTRKGYRVLMHLTHDAKPVPFGAIATMEGGANGIVDEKGQVYLSGVPAKGHVTVSLGQKTCSANVSIPKSKINQPVIEIDEVCK